MLREEHRVRRHPVDEGHQAVLRVEVQHTVRLPASGAILFLIRTQMCTLGEIAAVLAWLAQLTAVVTELPDDLAHDKGYAAIREELTAWLRRAATDRARR
ncbi:heme-dependent oxidative N-demethylase subunit alpha family protein [Mycobacterium sp. WMMD1722]|uniref:heme-dependent oxidative N-demethylase subunit alpha family protein n=1 Tax=Mycobacterium sp. WMMD1722 TaxID=3404117 RepID=UPI003BF482D6